MQVTGGCHCGAIRLEAEIDPRRVVACHCTDCQQMGGGAFRVLVPVPEASLRLLGAAPAQYEKIADSGRRRVQGFCGRCGTHLFATDPADAPAAPRTFTLRVGTLDQRAALAPTAELWCASRAPWLPPLPATRRVERQ